MIIAGSVHLCHVIAHPAQLYSGSKQVELMQTGDVGIESLFGSRLYVLVTKCIIDTRGTFANQSLQRGIVSVSQQQHFFTDLFIHAVVAPLVSHVGI